MAISRKALLISAPGEVGREDYIEGVKIDARRYKQLLMSPVGGAWNADEIIHLESPTADGVRDMIKVLAYYDYNFVMFTGHGWYSDNDKDRILELSKGQQIASGALLECAGKRTIVLDSCQKVYKQSLMEKLAHFANESRAAELRTPDREACRAAFDRSIQTANKGFLRLMSCKIDEFSYVDNERGSRYSLSLIDAVNVWAHGQAQNQNGGIATLSAVAAHNLAAQETSKQTKYEQNPSIEKPGTMPYFPLGVFA